MIELAFTTQPSPARPGRLLVPPVVEVRYRGFIVPAEGGLTVSLAEGSPAGGVLHGGGVHPIERGTCILEGLRITGPDGMYALSVRGETSDFSRPGHIIDADTLACWRFQDTELGVLPVDLGPYGLVTSVVGGSVLPPLWGPVGPSGTFGPQRGVVSAANAAAIMPDLAGEFTWGVLFRTTSNKTYQDTFSTSARRAVAFYLYNTSGELRADWFTDNASGSPTVTSGSMRVPLGTWTRVIGVRTSSSTHIYINGVLAGTNASVPLPPAGYFSGAQINLGVLTQTGNNFLGDIGEIFITKNIYTDTDAEEDAVLCGVV